MNPNRCTHGCHLVTVVDQRAREIAVRECQAWRWTE